MAANAEGWLDMETTVAEAGRIVIAMGAIHGFVYALFLYRLAKRLARLRWVDPDNEGGHPSSKWTAERTDLLLLKSPVRDARFPAELRSRVELCRSLLFAGPLWVVVYILVLFIF